MSSDLSHETGRRSPPRILPRAVVLAGLLVLICIITIEIFSPQNWPPNWLQRKRQRETVVARVEAVGGWSVLERACAMLVETNRSNVFIYRRWHWQYTNELDGPLRVLQPQEVRFYSPDVVSNDLGVAVVRVKIFGIHSTGGNSSPYYGLEFVFGSNAHRYRPPPNGGASGIGNRRFRLITNDVYEIF